MALPTQVRAVMTADAPDHEVASAISLPDRAARVPRIETLGAYDAAEVDGTLGRLACQDPGEGPDHSVPDPAGLPP
ncbi:MAG: hypothetical protein LC790_20865 [Actinobacteria bacterium]|nr:hypothetical protein [Actinomycetota bacterium]